MNALKCACAFATTLRPVPRDTSSEGTCSLDIRPHSTLQQISAATCRHMPPHYLHLLTFTWLADTSTPHEHHPMPHRTGCCTTPTSPLVQKTTPGTSRCTERSRGSCGSYRMRMHGVYAHRGCALALLHCCFTAVVIVASAAAGRPHCPLAEGLRMSGACGNGTRNDAVHREGMLVVICMYNI